MSIIGKVFFDCVVFFHEDCRLSFFFRDISKVEDYIWLNKSPWRNFRLG